MTDDNAHALLSASAAARWSTCAPSLRLHNAVPDRPSKYADEGTAAHTVAAWCLENDAQPDEYPQPAVEVSGVQWPVTQEMKNAVADYCKVVREHAVGGTLLVEQRVNYAYWLDVDEDRAFGTSDAVILHDDRITVIDLKYGQGVPVHAYENDADGKAQVSSQLALYTLGAMYEYEHLGDFKSAKMVIVQPRLDHVSVCEADVTDLKTFGLRMKAAAHKAIRFYENVDDPPLDAFKPSDKACMWCNAKHSCPALRAEVETETRDFFGHLVFSEDPPAELPQVVMAEVEDDVLSRVMSKVPLLEDFLKAIRAEVERRLLAGQPVTGFKLVEGRAGPRSWTDEEKALKDLRRHLGAKDAVVIKPISPTQVEKEFLKKGLLSQGVWKNLNKNIDRSDGKPSVAPESDRRPAIGVTSVEEKFAGMVLREQLEASVAVFDGAEDLV